MMRAQQAAERPIRLVAMRRRHGMTHAAFRWHWREVHAPLMAAVPGIKYVQNHVLAGIEPLHETSSAAALDGFAWIDANPQFSAPTSTPRSQPSAAAEDLPNFVGASSRMTCKVRGAPPSPGTHATSKAISIIEIKRENPSGNCQDDHLSDLLALVALIPGLVACRQNIVTGFLPMADRRIADACVNALAVVELWFSDTSGMHAALESPERRGLEGVSSERGLVVTSYLVEEAVIV